MIESDRPQFPPELLLDTQGNRSEGGTRYAIDAIPFSKKDWKQHFGPVWGQLLSAKRRYDPDNVLTPGQGIF